LKHFEISIGFQNAVIQYKEWIVACLSVSQLVLGAVCSLIVPVDEFSLFCYLYFITPRRLFYDCWNS